MHSPDFLTGVVIGALIGLTIVALTRNPRCPPTA